MKQTKKALITGITGQDGSYLAEFLLDKGYIVYGIKRRSSSFNTARIDRIYQDPHERKKRLILKYGDVTDVASLINVLQKVQPDEIYNLAAQSHVKVSYETPLYTTDTDALGALRILEAIRILGIENKTKFYQASTSEMFSGLPGEAPQNEKTPFHPRSPYGVAKLYAHWITVNYREAYNIFACSGILFNHESPKRGETFVTRKITRAATRISIGLQDKLYLGNLNSKRDWGHAKDYIRAMWLMLQQKKPDDYIIATGKQHSVRDFCELAFRELGINIKWQGKGIDEIGVDKITNKILVKIDANHFRPAEVESLLGNATKAKKILKWKPEISFNQLVKEMIKSDLEEAKQDLHLVNGGFKIKSNLKEHD